MKPKKMSIHHKNGSNIINSREYSITIKNDTIIKALILTILLHTAGAQNIDTLYPIEILPSDSQSISFGHSVLMYKHDAGVQFLIGAPKDRQNGSIFKCALDEAKRSFCHRQNFKDLEPDNFAMNFGANLLPDPRHQDRFLSCAFSQVTFCNERRNDSFGEVLCEYERKFIPDITHANPNGVCYFFDTNNDIKHSIRPFPRWQDQFFDKSNHLAYAFTGFSASWTTNGERLLLGVPGLNEFTGGALQVPFAEHNQASSNLEEEDSDQQYDLSDMRTQDYLFGVETARINLTAEIVLAKGYSYAGYSLAIGRFWNDKQSLVLGAPRRHLFGAVDIYHLDSKQNQQTIVGEQSGEYFGASVLVSDVNGDGIDDLLVGSPTYSSFKKGFDDEGKVTVLLFDQQQQKLLHQTTLKGLGITKARFGTAISSLADINLDGYNDVVIGAPYENENTGAIYIYHGSDKGIKSTFAQRITAKEDLKNLDQKLLGFGFSFSTQLDVDNNGFSDTLVGAYLSNSAVMLRTKPIVSLEPEIIFNQEKITFQRKCLHSDKSTNQKPCMDVRFCVDIQAPVEKDSVEMLAILKGDVRKDGDKRVYFVQNNESLAEFQTKFVINRSQKICPPVRLFIKEIHEIDNFVQPLEFELEFRMAENKSREFEDRWLKEPVFELKNSEKRFKNISIGMCNGLAVDCLSMIVLNHAVQINKKMPNHTGQIIIPQGEAKNVTVSLNITNQAETAIMPFVTIRLNSTNFDVLKQDPKCQEPKYDKDDNSSAIITCELDRLLDKRDTLEMVFVPFNETVLMAIKLSVANKLHQSSITERTIIFRPIYKSSIRLITPSTQTIPYIKGERKIPFNATFGIVQDALSVLNITQLSFIYPSHYLQHRIVDTAIMTKTSSNEAKIDCSTMRYGERSSQMRAMARKPPKELINFECDLPNVQCTEERCIISPLAGNSSMFFLFKNILLPEVLGLNRNQTAKYKIKVEAKVLDNWAKFDNDSVFKSNKYIELLFESHIIKQQLEQHQIWPIIAAIIAGLLILLLIILILIRLRFFVRKRPASHSARMETSTALIERNSPEHNRLLEAS